MIQFLSILCVFGIACGQILFKLCSNSLSKNGLWAFSTLSLFVAVMALYGVTSIGWVWILQKASLGKVYPFMALAFIFVPVGCHFIFGERFNIQYMLGVVLISCGVALSVKS